MGGAVECPICGAGEETMAHFVTECEALDGVRSLGGDFNLTNMASKKFIATKHAVLFDAFEVAGLFSILSRYDTISLP